jgi:hypothetical protein
MICNRHGYKCFTPLSCASEQANNDGAGKGKQSNPKDVIGSTKLPLELVPDTIEVEVALAYLEGALKYGRYNWRLAGVRASIYYAAFKRHSKKWWNGENADKNTRVKHLASAIACLGILLDAELCGKLEDDRPPSVDLTKLIDSADATVAHLKELFKDHNPKHYTIKDSE